MNKDSQVNPHAPKVNAYCDYCGWPANLPVLACGDSLPNGKSTWKIHSGPVFDFGPFNAHRSCFNEWHKPNTQEVQK